MLNLIEKINYWNLADILGQNIEKEDKDKEHSTKISNILAQGSSKGKYDAFKVESIKQTRRRLFDEGRCNFNWIKGGPTIYINTRKAL